MKKLLSILLVLGMMLQLCACDTQAGNDATAGSQPGGSNYYPMGDGEALDPSVAELICGTWYPDPNSGDGCIQVWEDGTCNIYGMELTYQVVEVSEEEITVDASGIWMTFLVRNPEFPVLFEETYGYCIPYQGLWQFAGQWSSDDASQGFYLDIGEIPYWDFDLDVGEDFMSIVVTDGDQELYQVNINMGDPPTANVLNVMDGTTMYFNPVSDNGMNCDHEYILLDSQAPTCTQTGSNYYQCQWCGNSYTETLPPAEHSYVNRICEVCGYEKPQGALLLTLNSDGTAYTVTGVGTWDEPNLVIPAEYNGLPVTAIGDEAFKGNTLIESVVIPGSVLEIGIDAFKNCASLATVDLAEGLTTIRKGAFLECTALTEIQIPNTVTTLESEMFFSTFGGCTSLTSVILPEGLETISEFMFIGCAALTDVYIPDSVTKIEDQVFQACSALKSVALPENLKEIGAGVFLDCTALEQINLPSSLTYIGTTAFMYCQSLSVTLPSDNVSLGDAPFSKCKQISVAPGVTNYKVIGNCLIYLPEKMLVCTGLTYTLPTDSSITFYGNKCFSDSEMTSFVIPDHITRFGDYIFFDCPNLQDITLPQGITMIPAGLFMSLPIESIVIPDTVTKIYDYAFSFCENLKTVVIPDSVTYIGSFAFANCTALESIVIPSSVTKMGSYVFQSCFSLTDVTVLGRIELWETTFNDCTALESFVIPEGALSLYGTFYGCTSLKNVTIPSSVITLGENTFRGCDSLESMIVPDTVKEMGSAVFMECSNLKHVTLPAGLTALPQTTFSWCESLETVTIPGTVTTIETHAFCMCNQLQTVYFGGTQDQWDQISIEGDYNEPLGSAQIVCG